MEEGCIYVKLHFLGPKAPYASPGRGAVGSSESETGQHAVSVPCCHQVWLSVQARFKSINPCVESNMPGHHVGTREQESQRAGT